MYIYMFQSWGKIVTETSPPEATILIQANLA